MEYLIEYLIVGAGISGLYTAYSLYKKFGTNNILIIEKNDRIGGRIYSLNLGFKTIEIGAGVILLNQYKMLKLVNELGLNNDLVYNKLIKYNAKLNYINNNYKITSITDINKTKFFSQTQDLKNKIDNNIIDKKTARSYSLLRLIEREYGINIANDMNNEFGYDEDFDQNAIDGINMLLRENDMPYYILQNGMEQIIIKLKEFLEKKGIKIMRNTKCTDIQKYNDKYRSIIDNNQYIESKHIILAIPKNNLCSINYLIPLYPLLDSVFVKHLMKIYLIFPTQNGNVWFQNLNGIITTNTILSQITPIDKLNGLLMIYISGSIAKSWYYLKSSNKLKQEIMYHLRRTFNNINIPNPIKLINKFWDEATHLWKPTYDSEILNKQIIQPFLNERIYIVGEAYSMIQQWSEGALDTVDNLMKIIK